MYFSSYCTSVIRLLVLAQGHTEDNFLLWLQMPSSMFANPAAGYEHLEGKKKANLNSQKRYVFISMANKLARLVRA